MKKLATFIATVFLIQIAVHAQGQRPNVLFITSDDLGLQLSCYGDEVIETPNLDALAASGVQFDVAWECLGFKDYFDFVETGDD